MSRLSERLSKIEEQLDRMEALLRAKTAGKRVISPRKTLYGKTVRLSKEEYASLKAELSDETDAFIAFFDGLKVLKGYVYASDYMAMQKWAIRAWHERLPDIQRASAKETGPTKDANAQEREWRKRQCG